MEWICQWRRCTKTHLCTHCRIKNTSTLKPPPTAWNILMKTGQYYDHCWPVASSSSAILLTMWNSLRKITAVRTYHDILVTPLFAYLRILEKLTTRYLIIHCIINRLTSINKVRAATYALISYGCRTNCFTDKFNNGQFIYQRVMYNFTLRL